MNYLSLVAAAALLFCGGTLFGGVSTAVIGKSDAADALFAVLSENEEIDLYEREEINKVLDELALAAMNARDLTKRFPHVEYFAVAGTKELIIFDARKGIRISETQLTDDPVEAVALAAETLKLWLDSSKGKTNEAMNAFGIVESANNGVPRKYRGDMRQFQRDLLRMLAAEGGTAVLERTQLGAVSRERELSDLFFPLLPSTHLLRLEYTPGTESIIVNCTVREIDGDGKILAAVEVKNILRNRDAAMATLKEFLLSRPSLSSATPSAAAAGELVEYKPERISGARTRHDLGAKIAEEDFPLFVVPPEELTLMLSAEEVNRRKEAERFFAQGNLDSALALDPENPLFRWKQLEGMLGFLHIPPVMRENCATVAGLIKTMAESFGDDPKYLRAHYRIITVPHGDLPDYMQSEHLQPTVIPGETPTEEVAKARNAARSIRLSMESVFAKELAKTPTTAAGLQSRLEALSYLYANMDLYYDLEEVRTVGAEGVAQILDLLEATPDDVRQKVFSVNRWYHVRNAAGLLFFEGLAPQALYANIDKAKAGRLPEIQAMATYWQFLYDLETNPPHDNAEFQTRAETFFADIAAIAGPDKSEAMQSYALWLEALTYLRRVVPAKSNFTFDSPQIDEIVQKASKSN